MSIWVAVKELNLKLSECGYIVHEMVSELWKHSLSSTTATQYLGLKVSTTPSYELLKISGTWILDKDFTELQSPCRPPMFIPQRAPYYP